MKAVVAAFNQEKALVGAFSVITNLRMELFEALVLSRLGATAVPLCSMGEATAEHVYRMLKKNFDRVYHGEEDELGFFVEGSRAPWGLYMHAAWFFGQQW